MAKKRIKSRKIVHPPYSKFEGFLKEHGIKLQDIADLLGCTLYTVCDKNKGRSDYSMSEVNNICNHYAYLGLDTSFFKTQKVTNM
jgi:hypothetical protein